jgi:hypothetical protein
MGENNKRGSRRDARGGHAVRAMSNLPRGKISDLTLKLGLAWCHDECIHAAVRSPVCARLCDKVGQYQIAADKLE